MNSNEQNGFVAWEYTGINVNRNHVPLYRDCFQNFGWTFIEQTSANPSLDVPHYDNGHNVTVNKPSHDNETVTLKFKRDSRLPNKIQLDTLQRKCEDALSSIQKLEGKKEAYKLGGVIGFGMIGALFLGLAIYNLVAASIPLCILFAAISLIGWGGAFYSIHKILPKKSAQLKPQIEQQFEVVYQTCEQASTLLA